MQPSPPYKTWYILGAGAISSLWGGYLQLSGFPVVSICRKNSQRKALQLNSKAAQHSIEMDYQLADSIDVPIEQLLICTKAQHSGSALASVAKKLSPNAKVLSVQNGISNEVILEQLNHQPLFAAVTTDGTYKQGENKVVHAGFGKTFIGAISPNTALELSQTLIESLPGEFLQLNACDNILQRQIGKLAINCAVNGLTAIYRCQNGELLTDSSRRARLETISNETEGLLRQLWNTPFDNPLFQQVCEVCQTTAENYSSMYQDIYSGRCSEIDAINGYLCNQAQQHALPHPCNKSLIEEVKALEAQLNCY